MGAGYQADSGFGSRETSVSPLPSARSFTSSTNKLSSSLLRAHQNDHLSPPSTANIQTSIDDEELPNALSSLSISSLSRETNSNKRRISQVSNLSCTARASTSSLIAEGESLNLRHVNEVESPDLEAFASEQLDAHRYERNEPGTEDERDEEESVSPIVPLVKSVSNTASSTFPVQPRGIQSTFGQRTSIPTRQPLSMRI